MRVGYKSPLSTLRIPQQTKHEHSLQIDCHISCSLNGCLPPAVSALVHLFTERTQRNTALWTRPPQIATVEVKLRLGPHTGDNLVL